MPKLSLLLLPALVLACTPMATPGAAVPAAPPTAMTVVDGFPHGTYTTTMAAGDIPVGAPAEMAGQLVGPWVLAFGDNGHALVSFNGRQVVDATYSLSGNELILGTDTGEYACNSNARYTWHAAGGELHLTKVEDACDGRVLVLSKHPLVRR
jgi:hypothetical protein